MDKKIINKNKTRKYSLKLLLLSLFAWSNFICLEFNLLQEGVVSSVLLSSICFGGTGGGPFMLSLMISLLAGGGGGSVISFVNEFTLFFFSVENKKKID